MVPPSEPGYITIEVTCAFPHRQFLKRFEVPAGTSLARAIELSGVNDFYPKIDRGAIKTGIHGKIASPETVLQQYDRVEIYRPLLIDPKEKRRLRSGKLKKK